MVKSQPGIWMYVININQIKKVLWRITPVTKQMLLYRQISWTGTPVWHSMYWDETDRAAQSIGCSCLRWCKIRREGKLWIIIVKMISSPLAFMNRLLFLKVCGINILYSPLCRAYFHLAMFAFFVGFIVMITLHWCVVSTSFYKTATEPGLPAGTFCIAE